MVLEEAHVLEQSLAGSLVQHNAQALRHAGTLDPEEAKKLERSLDEAGAAALWGGLCLTCIHERTS